MPLPIDAAAILRRHDRGTYTVPSSELYPHQWAWDSAFAAIGWAHIDPNRGLLELETLLAAQWPDGRVHHSGITTVFTPNTVVPYEVDGATYDIDFNSVQEGHSATQPTYAAITARSYHPGLVHTAWMDGSVRSVVDSVEPRIWRAWSTRAGGEIAAVP